VLAPVRASTHQAGKGRLWRHSPPDPRTPSTSHRGEDPYTQANMSCAGTRSTSQHGEDPHIRANTSMTASPSGRSSASTPGHPGRQAPSPHSSDAV
jgi:hypothetical protein